MNFIFPTLAILVVWCYHTIMDSIQQQNPPVFSIDSNTNIEETIDDVSYEDDGAFDESHRMLPIVTQDTTVGTKRKFSDSLLDTYTSSSEESFDDEAH